MYEFHVSRTARRRYQFDETLFSFNGNVILADFGASRRFAQKINAQRDLLNQPEQVIYASQLNAMGLIDEVLHYVVEQYRRQVDPQVMTRALSWLEVQVGVQRLNDTLLAFTEQFPPLDVYRGETSLAEYFYGSTDGVPHRRVVLEELLLLWLANANPAFSPFGELFDDRPLIQDTAYARVLEELGEFFDQQPEFGPFEQHLVDMLGSPSKHAPDSLQGQLRFMADNWGTLIGKYLSRILRSLDFISEEQRVRLLGPGPAQAPDLSLLADTPERFSQDKDWMSKLVLLAKNAYVWLYQLSRKYQRDIRTLDQVPDEELAYLSQCGFNGLWLIGLWQRSEASRRIKQMMGNPDAIASAYSLYDYRIADELGGEGALANLRQRAWEHCIRLASDMVPNHTGIDSRWIVEHPDWFLSLEHSPFPGYTFNGVDLMPQDQRVGIYLEDHYYDRTDAAVVFKRYDHHTGDTRYIYHGNDGTSMPWNDTAQLNYLKAEVREAVIQTILDVARRFPIIRFDAAMTLAKQHIQRLWFPEPGSGGDIPSRAEHGLSKAQFDRLVPREFWLEVVDRVAQEVPETLLLAEAFWMMEGYFVRTLGMHRVYNSAFMHMLRDEDNTEYRKVIKSTLEFNPQILKRYVNFMNNPDEDTAIAQFGDGDKYFGVCTLMATLPGLPMFGHGQVEGYGEKYGMEYYRAYMDESPNEDLVQRHQRQIFPLLHRRKLFAEVDHFLLYDFYTSSGTVNEDVFVYSNRFEDQRALVLYHNRFGDTRGWLRTSVAAKMGGNSEEGTLQQRTVGQGLALPAHGNAFVVFREQISGLEFIRSCAGVHERGLYFELNAYQSLVLLDFRVVYDSPDEPYARLVAQLGESGVADMAAALRELEYQIVHVPYRELVNGGMFRFLVAQGASCEAVRQAKNKYEQLLAGVQAYLGQQGSVNKWLNRMAKEYRALVDLPQLNAAYPAAGLPYYRMLGQQLADGLHDRPDNWGVALAWLFTHNLGRLAEPKDEGCQSQEWVEDWLMGKIVRQALADIGVPADQLDDRLALVKTLLWQNNWLVAPEDQVGEILKGWLHNPQLQSWLKINRYEGVLWFNREAMQDLLWWSLAMSVVHLIVHEKEDLPRKMTAVYRRLESIRAAVESSGYQVEKLLAGI